MPNQTIKQQLLNTESLIRIFNNLFAKSHQTKLVGGASEPLYLPKRKTIEDFNIASDYHRIFFREDFFSSALHEIAHWCIAGEQRRQQTDYGYWYEPDGRNAEQQKAFYHVEIKPQALEKLFSQACGIRFSVSVDNLDADINNQFDIQKFKCNVDAQAQTYLEQGLPARAKAFYEALLNA